MSDIVIGALYAIWLAAVMTVVIWVVVEAAVSRVF